MNDTEMSEEDGESLDEQDKLALDQAVPLEKESYCLLSDEFKGQFCSRLFFARAYTSSFLYAEEREEQYKEVLTEPIYNILTKDENPPQGDEEVPEENTLSQSIVDQIWKQEKTCYSLTIVVGLEENWRRTSRGYSSFKVVRSKAWTVVNVEQDEYDGWTYTLSYGGGHGGVLKVNIKFNPCGVMISKVKYHCKIMYGSSSSTNYNCIVFEGIRHDIKRKSLVEFMTSRGKNPGLVKRYTAELRGLLEELDTKKEFFKRFLDRIEESHLYEYRDALNDVLLLEKGMESFNSQVAVEQVLFSKT